jgi:hypothetical protein
LKGMLRHPFFVLGRILALGPQDYQ